MNAKDLVDEIFRQDEDIRWVGVVDQAGKILNSVQRPGVESLVDSATDELTLREFPAIMGLFWRELVGRSGELKSLLVACTRVYLFAFYLKDLLVVISFEPAKMRRVLRSLEAKYGNLLPGSAGLS